MRSIISASTFISLFAKFAIVFALLIPITAFSRSKVIKIKKAPKKYKGLKVTGVTDYTFIYVDSVQTEAQIFNFSLLTKANHKIDSDLTLNLALDLSLESGSNKSLYVDEFAARSGVSLNEAVLNWTPSIFDFKIGSINQNVYDNPLIFSPSASFPGIMERVTIGGDFFQFYLQSEQAIPNNQNLTSRIGSVQEDTPHFIEARAGIKSSSMIDLDIYGGIYRFGGLSNGIAAKSRLLGNSATGLAESSTTFSYLFEGMSAGANLKFSVYNTLELFGKIDYIKNSKAPTKRNQAYIVRAGLESDLFVLSGELFRNESDVTPAYYSSKFYGHSNREGISVNLRIKEMFRKMDFSIKYIDGGVIDKNTIYQSDFKVIMVNLMRLYDFY